jgi:CRISPR-associated protein Cmr4
MKKSYWLQAVTPLHSGTGRGLGYIDTPVAREVVTNWPYVPASSVKGVLRDYYADNDKTKDLVNKAFGAGGENNSAGALVFTDAKIVCLPIRSLYGTFAWCCSTVSLNRIKRDLELAGIESLEKIPEIKGQFISVTNNSSLKNNNVVYLEDLDLNVDTASQTQTEEIANFLANKLFNDDNQKQMFKNRFAIVGEEIFNFLCETGTEVTAHNRINDETKVTDTGALWYEETLPAETILFGFVWKQSFYKEKLDVFCEENTQVNLQLGGKSSVGKGQIICNFRK